MKEKDNWKMMVFVIGGIAGVVTGLAAAFMFIQRTEMHAARPKLTAGDGVRVGMGVLGVLSLIAELGSRGNK
jgi:nitrate reductase gamma subunit